jgi:hypothetical protein
VLLRVSGLSSTSSTQGHPLSGRKDMVARASGNDRSQTVVSQRKKSKHRDFCETCESRFPRTWRSGRSALVLEIYVRLKVRKGPHPRKCGTSGAGDVRVPPVPGRRELRQ